MLQKIKVCRQGHFGKQNAEPSISLLLNALHQFIGLAYQGKDILCSDSL